MEYYIDFIKKKFYSCIFSNLIKKFHDVNVCV